MSVDYYLVCRSCQKRIHVAQTGLGGWSFYSGEADCMSKLSAFVEDHAMEHPLHCLQILSEDDQMSCEWPEIEWRARVRSRQPSQPQPRSDLEANPGPYSVVELRDGRFDVIGSRGISTGYLALRGNSLAGAHDEADRLNDIWSGRPSDPVTPKNK